MSSEILDKVPNVEIDNEGTYKYILIRVYSPQSVDGNQISKMIVRGFTRCDYHADIYDETVQKLQKLKLDSECVGGGRIKKNAVEKKIEVYGYSQGFGKADHEVAVGIMKPVFPDYTINWSDDGY